MMRLLTIAIVLSLTANCCLSVAGSLFKADEPRPADAIILFDGKDLSDWVKAGSAQPASWKVENGYVEVNGTGNITTRQYFQNYQLHVEFWLPLMPDAKGQARANSGVYNQARY